MCVCAACAHARRGPVPGRCGWSGRVYGGDPGWRIDPAGVKNAFGGGAERGGLDDGPGAALEGDGVHAAELDCDSPPGGVSASFGDAHEFEDALGPERLGAEHLTWDGLLAAYDDERTSASVAVAELRRIGRDQVEHTPEWGSMTPVDFETWTQQTLAGQQLYFYGNNDKPDL